tara:strand:- start:260 stop:526 length:267 start_codon:yes stop_codon:yes gene_type:complete
MRNKSLRRVYVSSGTGECLSVGIDHTPVCVIEYNTSDKSSVEQARRKLQDHLGLNHLPMLYTSDPEYSFTDMLRNAYLKLVSLLTRSR